MTEEDRALLEEAQIAVLMCCVETYQKGGDGGYWIDLYKRISERIEKISS